MKPVKAQQSGKAEVWRGILRLGLAIVMLTSVLASGVEAPNTPVMGGQGCGRSCRVSG